jgi:dihydrofolate synthase/folylpolyglutamate synthase
MQLSFKKKQTEFNLKGNVYNSVTTAYETAANNATNDDFIYIGGSTFVAEAPLNKACSI